MILHYLTLFNLSDFKSFPSPPTCSPNSSYMLSLLFLRDFALTVLQRAFLPQISTPFIPSSVSSLFKCHLREVFPDHPLKVILSS